MRRSLFSSRALKSICFSPVSRSTRDPICIFCQHCQPLRTRQRAFLSSTSSPAYAQETSQNQLEQAKSDVKDEYVPATVWDGLGTIGGETEFDVGWEFDGFARKDPLQTKGEIVLALRRAIVEVLAIAEHGRSLDDPLLASGNAGPLVNDTIEVKIIWDKDARRYRLEYPSSACKDSVMSTISVAKDERLSPEDVQFKEDSKALSDSAEVLGEALQAQGEDWLHMSITDPLFKFTILKRFYKISGIRVPDAEISTLRSISALLKLVSKPPTPKKLAESLLADLELEALPNVTIKDRRQTPVDKEKHLGRWKVIEKELVARKLALPGGWAKVRSEF